MAVPFALPYMLLLSFTHILHYTDRLCKRFFVFESGVVVVSTLGGPPRANAGRFSAAGRKAGSKAGSAPWQFPAGGLAGPGEWSLRELPSL